HFSGQLEVGHDRAGEGHRADEHADEHLGVVDTQQGTGQLTVQFGLEVAVPADQHGGQADERVQQAMSSGISVIWTLRARHSPMAAPMSTATAIMMMPVVAGLWLIARATVEIRARAMPAMPNDRPRRAVSCLDSPASDRMNSSAATR